VAKFLIDECLHTSLLKLAHEAGFNADHVNYLGLGSSKDWDLMKPILNQAYTFVTNDRIDFLALYRRTQLHAGLHHVQQATAVMANTLRQGRLAHTRFRQNCASNPPLDS